MSETYEVELTAGGKMLLQSPDEVDRWETLQERYKDDYRISKTNDLALLDVVLQQHIVLFRAQQQINGLVPELDEDDLPTGKTERLKLSAAEMSRQHEILLNASKEIRSLEEALGVNKKARDASGSQTLADYLDNLRSAANEYGVHITERTKAFEQFCMDLRWRVRLNEVGDDEDKAYHDCTDEGVLRWARTELGKLEEKDKLYAQQRGKLWTGRL